MTILVTERAFLNTYKNRKLGQRSLEKKRHLFPIRDSSVLAGIVADLMSDGHIGSKMVIYSSNKNYNLIDFGKRIKSIFDCNYEIRDVITNLYGVRSVYVFDAPLLRILKLCGVPEGDKVLQEYSIPKWVVTNDAFMMEFIRRLYSNEGCVTGNKNRIRIKIIFHKNERILENSFKFLESIRSFLSKKNIKSTNVFKSGFTIRKKDGIKTIGLAFEIHGTRKNMSSVLNFYNFIGFNSKEKKKKLERLMKKIAP